MNVVINQEENSKNITLRLTPDAIYIVRMIKFEKCQYYLKLTFSKNAFKEYIVDNELEIIFNGQTFIKTCKNIQKNNDDKIKIIYENSELKIVITNLNKKKVETIILNNNNISCYVPQDKLLPMNIAFKNIFYKFNTIDFSNLKKSINLKNETINISIFEDEFIVFESRSQGTSPLHILYGDLPDYMIETKNDTSRNLWNPESTGKVPAVCSEGLCPRGASPIHRISSGPAGKLHEDSKFSSDNSSSTELVKPTKITINIKILNLLAKINLLVSVVNIYQSLENNIIKIFGEFIYPKNNNTGQVEIIICSDQKK